MMTRTFAIRDLAARDWAVFAIASVVIFLDQVSKFLVRLHLSPGQSVPEDGPIRLSHYTNTGAAFSLFPNQTALFIVVAIVAISIIVLYSRQLPKDGGIVRVGLGLQLGGAAGNLIDRVLHGQVTDFIDLGFWPVFNIADSSIVVGVGLLAYFLLFYTPKPPEPVPAEGAEMSKEQ